MGEPRVPELRLGSFTANWEASTVGRLARIGSGRDYKHLNSGDVPVYGTGGYMLSVNEALSYTDDAIGIGRKGTIDNPFILRAPFWTVDTLFYVIPDSTTDLHFLQALFERVDWKAKDESTGVPSLNRGAIERTEVCIAEPLEQQQIGTLFSAIGSLLAQHRRKHQQLQQIRIALMQRMFPQGDADEPGLRGEGHYGSWKRGPLLDVITSITDFRGRTPRKLGLDWSEAGHLTLSANNVKQGYIDFSRDPHYGDDELYEKWMVGRELHKGQVLFTTEAPMGNVTQVPDSKKYILGQRVIAFSVDKTLIAEDFLRVLLESPRVSAQLTSLSSGGTAQGISQRSLAQVQATIPETLVEQSQIAQTFTKIDSLISAEQLYIAKLQQVKSGLLQKIFI